MSARCLTSSIMRVAHSYTQLVNTGSWQHLRHTAVGGAMQQDKGIMSSV